MRINCKELFACRSELIIDTQYIASVELETMLTWYNDTTTGERIQHKRLYIVLNGGRIHTFTTDENDTCASLEEGVEPGSIESNMNMFIRLFKESK